MSTANTNLPAGGDLWIGVLGTAPLMIGEWVFGLALERWFQWFSFILASLVQVLAGAPFIAVPGASLRHAARTWTRSWPSFDERLPTAHGRCSAVLEGMFIHGSRLHHHAC